MTRIIGIAGSLRKGSYNAALLRAAAAVAPDGMEVEIASIAGIPLYDGDLEEEHGAPVPVIELQEKIASSDGLLLVTPEYNASMPGVLKNAVDWLSRPPLGAAAVFGDRPVAIMGATPGAWGTRLAQAAWLPIFRNLGARVYFGKQLHVATAAKVFDAGGALIDDKARSLLTEFMAGFASFVTAR
jgi:chromate reductase, NAD(P)H dehydrogenase (quinone)